MIWTSRHFDKEKCLLLFGTRVDESSIVVLCSDDFGRAPDLLDRLVQLGRLSGIVLTL